jgi:AraC-like DNA-binding protein
MGERHIAHASKASVVEAGVHTPGLMRRHADRVLPVNELIVVQSGVLPIAEEDRRFSVPRDGWVLLRAGRRHYGYDDLDRDTWFYWLCFDAAPWGGDGTQSPALQDGRTGSVARPDRLRALLEHLIEDQQAAILTPSAAHGYLQLVLAEILLETTTTADPAVARPLAVRAAAFIADHITEPDLSTARIAGELAFNADHLGRAFRDAFGETLTDHVHRLRIDRARMLFRSTDRPVARVAAEVGFGDERYFRRIFKRRVGLTPGQFQRLRPSSGRAPRTAAPADGSSRTAVTSAR